MYTYLSCLKCYWACKVLKNWQETKLDGYIEVFGDISVC